MQQQKIGLHNWLIFSGLSLIWGFSFFFIKKGLQTFSPIQVASFRMSFAFLAFIPIIIINIKRLRIAPNKLKFVPLLGLFGNLFPAVCFCVAETKIDSAIVGIQNATTPIFALFLGSFFFGVPLTKNKTIGVLLGFIGCALIIIAASKAISQQQLSYHIFLPLIATLCYGINANLFKKYFQSEDPLIIALWQYAFVFLVCMPYLLFTDTFHRIQYNTNSMVSLCCLMLLGVLGTAIAQVYFNKLTQKTSALFATMTTFAIPIVSVAIGLIIGEKIGILHIAGLLIIFSGIYSVAKG